MHQSCDFVTYVYVVLLSWDVMFNATLNNISIIVWLIGNRLPEKTTDLWQVARFIECISLLEGI